jgi:hypothetical protein
MGIGRGPQAGPKTPRWKIFEQNFNYNGRLLRLLSATCVLPRVARKRGSFAKNAPITGFGIVAVYLFI